MDNASDHAAARADIAVHVAHNGPAVDRYGVSRDKLKATLEKLCVIRNAAQAISPSGKPQKWLIDLRRAFLDPLALKQISKAMLAALPEGVSIQLAGMETAAVPLLVGLLLSANLEQQDISGLIIRKERKTTGLGKTVEGKVSGAPVILVDDIFNSGDSAEKARVALEALNIKPTQLLVVIDYESKAGRDWQRSTGITVRSLFKLSDFDLSLAAKAAAPLRHRYSKALWHYKPAKANPYYVVPKSAPLLVNGRLYFGTDVGDFQCLEVESKELIWTFQAPGTHAKGIWSSCAHDADRIYFGAYNGNVYCLDATTGAVIWDQPYCEWVGSSPCVVPENGHLYIGLEYERPRAQGSIAALDLATGQKVWEHWLKVFQHGSGSYWREGDLVVFGTNDHDVRALNAKTGALVWKFETRRSVKYLPRIDDERKLVTFASFDGSIYILDVRDGRKLGEVNTDNICYTQPLISHGRIFCGSGDRHLYVINLDDMSIAKKIDCGARVYSSPRLIGGNSVIFGSTGGVVREIDPVTLEITGKLVVPDAVTNAVAFTEDGRRIFVPTYVNEVYCFERTQFA